MQLMEFVCHFSLCPPRTSLILSGKALGTFVQIGFLYFDSVANATQCLSNLNFLLWFTSKDVLQPKLKVCGGNTLVLLTAIATLCILRYYMSYKDGTKDFCLLLGDCLILSEVCTQVF